LDILQSDTNWALSQFLQDEKLEKLFTVFAENFGKRPLQDFVFRFDGQQLDGNKSPKDYDLEDEDIVEVHMKKARKK
jgi:hypothetical protein